MNKEELSKTEILVKSKALLEFFCNSCKVAQ